VSQNETGQRRKITVPVITERYPGEQWRAFVANDSVIQAEGDTPEIAAQALIPEIEYFTSDPAVDQNQKSLHMDLLNNSPEIGVTQITVTIPDKP
jgi:hypothetical protein